MFSETGSSELTFNVCSVDGGGPGWAVFLLLTVHGEPHESSLWRLAWFAALCSGSDAQETGLFSRFLEPN